MKGFDTIQNLYFIGIGGIGMSALARYALHQGHRVAGYDLTSTPLTQSLVDEGILIHYEDNKELIPRSFLSNNTLVVRTPAVPESHSELTYLRGKGYTIVKRSELLGFLTRDKICIAVAGTHGKTSVSTMTTHLLLEAGFDTGAFLGGISRNFNSNLVLPKSNGNMVVAEADEFDRSFLQLSPTLAIITSMDADHLDIYGTHEQLTKAFGDFLGKVKPGGMVLAKKGLDVQKYLSSSCKYYTYSIDSEADFYIKDIQIEEGAYQFNLITPMGIIHDIRFNYPGRVNVENMVAAAAVSLLFGAGAEKIKAGFMKFLGVERRFDIRFRNDQVIYIDDYAHHPEELNATIRSVKELFPGKKIMGIFQPHLFSRTRDFAEEFSRSLDQLDETILLDIYPARELPIPGISSDTVFNLMRSGNKHRAVLNDFPDCLDKVSFDVLLTLGAGNIDTLVPKIGNWLKNKYRNEN
jgi:UDP-N-acetylmuramate--alanine ligase